jgi:hypothetical protein
MQKTIKNFNKIKPIDRKIILVIFHNIYMEIILKVILQY